MIEGKLTLIGEPVAAECTVCRQGAGNDCAHFTADNARAPIGEPVKLDRAAARDYVKHSGVHIGHAFGRGCTSECSPRA